MVSRFWSIGNQAFNFYTPRRLKLGIVEGSFLKELSIFLRAVAKNSLTAATPLGSQNKQHFST